MKKALTLLLVSIFFMGCLVSTISAAIIPPAEPNWVTPVSGSCEIIFNGTQGTVSCNIFASNGTRNIYGTLVLYENDVQIDSWIINTKLPQLFFTDNFTGVRGCTYRLVLNATVVTDGTSEQIHDAASRVCS